MKENTMNKQKLITHIRRLQGQLNAVVGELEKVNTDCLKTSNTLFASSRSFSTLRQDFVKCFLIEEFKIDEKVSKSSKKSFDKFNSLMNLIKG